MVDQPTPFTLAVAPPSALTIANPAIVAQLDAALALAKAGKIQAIGLVYDDVDQGSFFAQCYVLDVHVGSTSGILLALELLRYRIINAHCKPTP